jgi:hypothetical protein
VATILVYYSRRNVVETGFKEIRNLIIYAIFLNKTESTIKKIKYLRVFVLLAYSSAMLKSSINYFLDLLFQTGSSEYLNVLV